METIRYLHSVRYSSLPMLKIQLSISRFFYIKETHYMLIIKKVSQSTHLVSPFLVGPIRRTDALVTDGR